MKKKNYQESNIVSGKDRKSKSIIHKKGIPTIKCVCDSRILVVPDLKAMDRAIKNHVSEHRQADYGLVSDSLEEFLTEQTLTVASEMNLPKLDREWIALRGCNR
jgi:hypothetical protein